MRHRRIFGLRLAILVCCTLWLQPAFALRSFYKRTYVISRVLDARTFDVARLGRVRLLGVAPAQNGRFADQAWQEAGAYCQANLVGAKVRLETDLQKSNIDGQRLVYLYLEDGTLVNLELIRSGYAAAESNAVRYLRKFKAAEEEARQNRVGIWSEGAVAYRQSEKTSALQALQSGPPSAQSVDKRGVDSAATPVPAASVSPPVFDPATPGRPPQGMYPGSRLFIEDMDKDLDSYIRAEIVKKKVPLVVVVDPEEADLIMTASASGTLIFNKADKVMLWASEAGGRSLWWVGLKREGPRKVAARLISNLKREMENPE